MTLVQKEPKAIKLWTTDIKKVYLGTTKVRPTRMYKYIRWTITANRHNLNVTQMSEFEICNNSWTKMARPSWTTITGNIIWPSWETVDKILDGSVYTKYCPNWALPVIITITLWSKVDFSTYNKYKRYTANDESGRDPVSWKIEVSEDWTNRFLVDNVANATITTTRYTLAYTGTMVRPSWSLWANTVAYYPFNWDILDHKWDYGITWTVRDLSVLTWTVSYATSFDSSKQAFYSWATSRNSWWCILYRSDSIFNYSWDFTVSYCFKIEDFFNRDMWFVYNRNDTNSWISWQTALNGSRYLWFHWTSNYVSSFQPSLNTWYNVTCTVISWTYYIYVNWSLQKSGSYWISYKTPSYLTIGWYYGTGSFPWNVVERLKWCISEVIIDKEWWDATKALDRAKYLWFA